MNSSDQKVRDIVESYFGQELQAHFLEQLETRLLQGGEWLFRKGDPGHSLYFLIRGRLRVWSGSGDPDSEDTRLLGEVVPGDSVGEVGLLSGKPRSAGIQAIRDSLLVRIDRTDFENLAEQHPALVIRLAANVGRILQEGATGSSAASRSLKTITLLPLHESGHVGHYCKQFSQALAEQGSMLALSADGLAALGAPVVECPPVGELPENLRHWLSDQEDEHDYVLYLCSSGDSAWSRFAIRQSDIVLKIADAGKGPGSIEWEPDAESSDTKFVGRKALILLQEDRYNITHTRDWLDGRRQDFHLQMEKGCLKDVKRAVRIVNGTATGLIIGGGAARGLSALGVFKSLVEHGVEIDWVGGTSIGSIMAGAIATNWKPDEAIDACRKAFMDGKPFGDFTIPVVSLLRGRRMRRLLSVHLDFQIEDLGLPYFCVSTNLGRGTKNIHEKGSLVRAIRASAALPGVMPPVVIDGELAIDGAIVNNLPVDIMQQKPVGKIIAVDFTAPVPSKVDYTELPSPWAILRGRWLPFARRYRVPGISSLILKATEAGTQDDVRKFGAMADLLIDPQVRQFGMTDVKSFDQIVAAGYERANELLSD